MARGGGGAPPGARGLDVPAAFGPAFDGLLPESCEQFSSLSKSLGDANRRLIQSVDKFLFGFESVLERSMNDTAASVRDGMSSLGMGDLADTFLGKPPERPAPHARLLMTRSQGGKARLKVMGVQHAPMGRAAADEVEVRLPSCADGWVSAWHVAAPAGEQHGAYSDVRVTAACGSGADFVGELRLVLDGVRETLAWLSREGSETAPDAPGVAFVDAYLRAFPRAADFAGRFLDFRAVKLERREAAIPGAEVLELALPVDLEKMRTVYPGLVELISLFNPFHARICHPDTEAVLLEYSFQDGAIQARAHVRDGYLMWADKVGRLAYWDADDTFRADIEIEFSLVPLGVSLAAIPFPKTRLRCKADRAGSLKVRCVEASEPFYPALAAAAFDVDHFRRLLVEDLVFEVEDHRVVPPGGGPASHVVRAFCRLAFPSASVGTLFGQWFRDLVLRDYLLDIFQVIEDFFKAVSRDTNAIRRRRRARAARDAAAAGAAAAAAGAAVAGAAAPEAAPDTGAPAAAAAPAAAVPAGGGL